MGSGREGGWGGGGWRNGEGGRGKGEGGRGDGIGEGKKEMIYPEVNV